MEFTPPKGMRDFYPEDVLCRNWLFSLWRASSKKFGFTEYDGPILETEELIARKSGEEILDQLYNFTDKGGRKVVLRPEMTPTLARMILAKGNSLPLPLKWFSIPQCFRYERMQKGRKREHYQWNLDIVGIEAVTAEAEIIACICDFFKSVGLTGHDVEIKIGSRKVLAEILTTLKISSQIMNDVFLVLDKWDKVPKETIQKMLQDIGLNSKQINSIESMLNSDNKNIETFKQHIEKAKGDVAVTSDIEKLFSYLKEYGVSDFCVFDIKVVRGLAYYTDIVFEAYDKEHKFRAICGGGRYNNLLKSLGGNNVPSIGFGFGDVVILEVLKEKNKLVDFKEYIDYFVIPFSKSERFLAIEVASKLRDKGNKVSILLEDKKLKNAMASANKSGAKNVVIVAPEEAKENKVVVKDLETGKESKITIDEI